MSIDFKSVAHKVVNHCLRIKPGEYFWILCGDDHYYNFCEQVAIEAIKVGAHPSITISSDRIYKTYLEQPVDYLKTPAKFSRAIIDFVDVELLVAFPRDPSIGEGADPEKMGAMAVAGKQTQEKFYERNSEGVKVRKASFLYPTKEQAKKYGVSFREFSDMVWRALDIDYGKLRQRARKIAGALKGADRVHITSEDGADLTFSIKGRPPFIDDGVFDEFTFQQNAAMMNLPTGEVCIAPIETSAEGVAVFGYNSFHGHDLRNIRMEFHNGKIVDIQGDEGAEYYKSVLEKQTGDKDSIAELGIGLNPEITKVLGELALDEKIIGTIHIATGENRIMQGKGVSSFHWDLIMTRPTLIIDGRVIMKEGAYKI